MQTPKAVRIMDAYYEDGNYYLEAQDAKQMFAHMGVTLILPDDPERAEDGKMKVYHKTEETFLTCHEQNGKVYYKMRDLAQMTGAEMIWNRETKEISMEYGDKKMTAARSYQVKDAAGKF